MNQTIFLQILIFSCLFVGVNAQPAIVMDGQFDDWEEISFIENTMASSSVIDGVGITNDDDFLYIRIQLKRELLLQSSNVQIWIDGDNNTNTGLRIDSDFGADLYYHLGEKQGNFSNTFVAQRNIDLVPLPTFSNNEFELRVRRSFFDGTFPATGGNYTPIVTNNSIKVAVTEGGLNSLNTNGVVTRYTINDNATIPFSPIDPAKTNDDWIRIVAYNILRDSPFNQNNRPAFERMINNLDADIYCFNEFWESSASQVKALMDEIAPLGTNEGWYAIKEDEDNITVSRYPIIQSLKINANGNATANILELPEQYGTNMLVINAHTICCEFEAERQAQIDAIMAFINEAKAPGGRTIIEENTPIVIAGDLNLVGQQQQLTTLLTGEIVNTNDFGEGQIPDWDGTPLADLEAFHTETPITYTWRSPFSSFAPGRLDYIIYTDSQLKAEKAFVLEPQEIPNDKLAALNLFKTDGLFSDHLPVVADFSLLGTTSTNGVTRRIPSLQVFPNPTADWVRVSGPMGNNSQLEVYNFNGQLLQLIELDGGQNMDIDLSSQPAGNYLIRYVHQDGVENYPVIKQ